jgi:hypothetical protein
MNKRASGPERTGPAAARRRAAVGLAALIILAVAVRGALFAISVRGVPAFDDECKIALQAKQIARGARPLLILASPYIFPLDAYLMAPFIHWLPRNAFGARVMAFALGLATVALSAAVLRRAARPRESWPGLLLILLPSAYFLMLQAGIALPGYPTLLCLSALTAWLAQRHGTVARRLWLNALLAGLAAGLAASITWLTLPVLAMAGLVIACGRNLRTVPVSAASFGVGALLGHLPHWAAQRTQPGAFDAVSHGLRPREALQRLWSPLMDLTLPAAFGWRPPVFPDHELRLGPGRGFEPVFSALWLAVVLAASGFVLRELWRRWRERRWPAFDLGAFFVGVTWLSLGLFLMSRRAHSHTFRYLILAVWSFPFLLAYVHARAGRVGRRLLVVLAAGLALTNAAATALVLQRWSRPDFADFLKLYDLQPVYRYLEQRGITRCYGSYPDAYRFTFDTDERIIGCQPYNERFAFWPVPFKEDVVDPCTNVAYVLSDTYRFPPGQFEEDLAAMRVTARRETCGQYQVYTDFAAASPDNDEPLPARRLSVGTSHQPEEAWALTDGDNFTRWRSHRSQEPGMWIEVRLRAPAVVSRLALSYDGYRYDRADALSLQAHDGRAWVLLRERIPADLDAFEFRAAHPVYGRETQTVRFDPVRTDRLRLEIAEPRSGRDWSIGEIRVFTPVGDCLTASQSAGPPAADVPDARR